MSFRKKIPVIGSKEKGLQVVMSLLLLLFCAGSSFLWERGKEDAAQTVLSAGQTAAESIPAGEGGTGTLEEDERTDGEADLEEMILSGTYHVVLDAGHGADDSGKVGINGALEKEINLQIVIYLEEQLEEAGVQVTLTRADDEPLYEKNASNKKMSDMKKRIAVITDASADAVVSVHQNSYTDPSVCGPQVFYYKDSQAGEQLAACIQGRFTDLLGDKNRRQIKANKDYYLLIHTPVPTVIVECGFLSNPEESGKLTDEEYQKQVAAVICSGIVEYLQQTNQ